jgi:hypothetical protein
MIGNSCPDANAEILIKRRRGLVAIGQVAEALVTGLSRSGSRHRNQSSQPVQLSRVHVWLWSREYRFGA